MVQKIVLRNICYDDIPKIVSIQRESYPEVSSGQLYIPLFLENHISLFQEGQFCAELDGDVVASATCLIVTLEPEYAEHTWKEITADGMFTNHNSNGDSLYGADISTHPKHRHEGIGRMIIHRWKELVTKLNLRRMIGGGRLFNYIEHADRMSPYEYTEKVIKGELKDLVLTFELDIGFKFVKILPNYLDDVRSMNYASFIEWINPSYEPNR